MKLVRSIRNGWIKPKPVKDERNKFYLLWRRDDVVCHENSFFLSFRILLFKFLIHRFVYLILCHTYAAFKQLPFLVNVEKSCPFGF